MRYAKKLNKIFLVLFLIFQVGVGFLLSSIFIFPSTANAWVTSQSAQAICWLNPNNNVNYVHIRVNFTNNDTNVNKAMNVVATDSWTGQSVDLGSVNVGSTATGEIKTGQTSIGSNFVTFHVTWSDGSSDFGGFQDFTANYNALECVQPAATPTPTLTLTPTPVIPQATATPTPVSLVSTPTPTPIATSQQVLIVREEVQITPTPTPRVQVLAARGVTELPRTGAANGVLFGLLALIPMGIIIRQKSKNIFIDSN